MDEMKKKLYFRVGLITLVLITSIFLCFYYRTKWYVVIPFAIVAGASAFILVRSYISYKRKKLYFQGKVLSITKPKHSVGRYVVILKEGKVSKKFYCLQKPNMRTGSTYVVVYEEKSNMILQYQEAKFQLNRNIGALKNNPKFR